MILDLIQVFHSEHHKCLYLILFSLPMAANCEYDSTSRERSKSALSVRLNICKGVPRKFFAFGFGKNFRDFCDFGFRFRNFCIPARNILRFRVLDCPFQDGASPRTQILNCRIFVEIFHFKSHLLLSPNSLVQIPVSRTNSVL